MTAAPVLDFSVDELAARVRLLVALFPHFTGQLQVNMFDGGVTNLNIHQSVKIPPEGRKPVTV